MQMKDEVLEYIYIKVFYFILLPPSSTQPSNPFRFSHPVCRRAPPQLNNPSKPQTLFNRCLPNRQTSYLSGLMPSIFLPYGISALAVSFTHSFMPHAYSPIPLPSVIFAYSPLHDDILTR